MTVFQKRLNQALTESGMTPAELSRKSGLSEAVISNYRRGEYEPRNKKLYLLATALNVSPSWLMGFDVAANEDALDVALQALWSEMSEDLKQKALDYMRYIVASQKTNT